MVHGKINMYDDVLHPLQHALGILYKTPVWGQFETRTGWSNSDKVKEISQLNPGWLRVYHCLAVSYILSL